MVVRAGTMLTKAIQDCYDGTNGAEQLHADFDNVLVKYHELDPPWATP